MPRTNILRYDGSFSFMLRSALPRLGRVTSDVITGMSITQSVGVGHIAKLMGCVVDVVRGLGT